MKKSMNVKTVVFEHVSKKYSLGLTRTSLPSFISNLVKDNLERNSQKKHSTEKSIWAVNDISFSLEKGESLALIGANGAGKTTILKLLSHITSPTSGNIRFYGNLSALIELGAGFHPDLTGRENIFLNGAILGLKRQQIQKKFDEIVEFAELERFIDTPVKRYSSGMAVRLGFAVASNIQPDILLVDEVLAVGDSSFQQKCLARIRSLINNGTSLIFVSHNLYMVQAVCNKALYLEKGKMKFIGETKQAIDYYEDDLHRNRSLKLETSGASENELKKSELEITKVEVLGYNELPFDLISSNQKALIRIHFHAYKNFRKAQASVFIRRADGLTSCMLRTKLDNHELSLGAGQGIVDVIVDPLQLVTGEYFAEAWFLDENDSMAIVPKGGRSDWFTVKARGLSYTDDSGVFEPKTEWRQNAVE